MATGGHFGCPKITFDCISGHFRSIANSFFSVAILDVRKSLSIAFLAISDRSAILGVRNSLSIAFLDISDRYGTFYIFLSVIMVYRIRYLQQNTNMQACVSLQLFGTCTYNKYH